MRAFQSRSVGNVTPMSMLQQARNRRNCSTFSPIMEGHTETFSKELYDALRKALSECIKQRPVDPCKFIAGTALQIRS